MKNFNEWLENNHPEFLKEDYEQQQDPRMVTNFIKAVGESRQKLVEMFKSVSEAAKDSRSNPETLIEYMKRMCNLLEQWLTPFDHKAVFPNGWEFRLINSAALQQFTSGQNSQTHIEKMIRDGKLRDLEETIKAAEEELTSHYKHVSGDQGHKSMVGKAMSMGWGSQKVAR